MKSARSAKRPVEAEAGFVLIAVLFLVALILIGLAVAAPKVAKSIQRDKELELIHRGNQYRRAIKLYYRKFGAYPSTVDQLINTNQVRFLRKRYTDPMTGKDDWKLVYFGQAHIKPMGLFGQTLSAGSMINAAGGGVGSPIAGNATDGSGSAFGSTSGSGFGSSSGSSFGSSSSSSFGAGSGSSFASSSSSGSGFGSSDGSSTASGFGAGAGTTTGGTAGSGAAGSGTTAGAFGAGSSGTNGVFGTSGSTGSTLGGGPIVGVVIPDTRASIKEYKKQKHYNEWEFVYDPIEEQMLAGAGGVQQNLNGASPIGSGLGSGFSSQAGGGTLMNGGQSGTSNQNGNQSGGSTPAQPQQ